jgi:hypothetical protein
MYLCHRPFPATAKCACHVVSCVCVCVCVDTYNKWTRVVVWRDCARVRFAVDAMLAMWPRTTGTLVHTARRLRTGAITAVIAAIADDDDCHLANESHHDRDNDDHVDNDDDDHVDHDDDDHVDHDDDDENDHDDDDHDDNDDENDDDNQLDKVLTARWCATDAEHGVRVDGTGALQLPMRLGSVTVHSLAHAVVEQADAEQLVPVGYCATRLFPSAAIPHTLSRHVCTIRRNGRTNALMVCVCV